MVTFLLLFGLLRDCIFFQCSAGDLCFLLALLRLVIVFGFAGGKACMSFLMCSVYRFVARFMLVQRMRIARFAPWGADSPIGAPIFGGFENFEFVGMKFSAHLPRSIYVSHT
jgi:hypothetical protein